MENFKHAHELDTKEVARLKDKLLDLEVQILCADNMYQQAYVRTYNIVSILDNVHIIFHNILIAYMYGVYIYIYRKRLNSINNMKTSCILLYQIWLVTHLLYFMF